MTKKYNTENLIPVTERTKSEAREISRKGGIRSGEVRRMRKTLREELLAILECREIQENLCFALIDKAFDGDTKAFQVIRDTIGEKPTDKIDFTAVNINLQKSYDEVTALIEKQKLKILAAREQASQIESQDYPPQGIKSAGK